MKRSKGFEQKSANKHSSPALSILLSTSSTSEIRMMGSLAQIGYFFKSLEGDQLTEFLIRECKKSKGWELYGRACFKDDEHFKERCRLWAEYTISHAEELIEKQAGQPMTVKDFRKLLHEICK